MFVLTVEEDGPENSCEEPQFGNTEGFEVVTGAGGLLLATVVFGNIEFPDCDWSVIIDCGVCMAFVSDESTDDAWE